MQKKKGSATWPMLALGSLGAAIGATFSTTALTLLPVQAVHAQTTCAAAWNASSVYTKGNTASENGIDYVANWWTQGDDPATHNGGAGSGQPWTATGSCGGSPAPTPTPAPAPTPTPTPAPAPSPAPATSYGATAQAGGVVQFYADGGTWADVHYSLAGGGQLNVRMANSGTDNTYQISGLSNGEEVSYWFTIGQSDGSAVDTPAQTLTYAAPTPAPTPSPTPTPSPSPVFPTAGTTFNLVNGTGGAYQDNQIYWTMVGQDPAHPGTFVHVDCSGALIPMAPGDNGELSKNGQNYADYSIPFSQCKSFTVPQILSARIYLSVGSPMFIQAVGNPVYGYTGPNIDNPTDPNIDVTYDFVEVNIDATNFYGNTTRVDQFGFPVRLRLQDAGGYDRTVGETETRAALFQEFVAQVPQPFQSLAQVQAPYRIVAPAHGAFGSGGAQATYLDSYIQSVWNQYRSQSLVFSDAQGTFTGHVVGNQFVFTDGQGTYYINNVPTTQEVLLGNGVFNDASNAAPGVATAKQLQIQAQLDAALNRHVAENAASWNTAASFYGSAPTNAYSAFWHAHSIDGLTYGFPYDDVRGFSSSLIGTNPDVATITVGW
jgi:hypothetical protein